MKRLILHMVAVFLVFSLLALAACDGSTAGTTSVTTEAKTESDVQTEAKTDATVTSGSRIQTLTEAWNQAGVKAAIEEESSSAVIKSMYGSIRQYRIALGDELATILEYDLDNLDGTGENYLKYIDENGEDLKTSDPAWHAAEFVLRNTFILLEGGEKKAEYKIEEHPQSQLIIDTFTSFK